jgi:hypothetical protein
VRMGARARRKASTLLDANPPRTHAYLTPNL